MPVKSSTTVEMKWDFKTKKEMNKFVQRLESRFNLFTIVLFGSRAAEMNLESFDWDLLLIIEGIGGNWLDKKFNIASLTDLHVDLHVYTRDERRNA